MSSNIISKTKIRSPYKNLLSANKNKLPTESTRKIYLN